MTSKIKKGCWLKVLTPETMKLLGSTKSKTTKDGNSENMTRFEITKVVLFHCNIFNNDYQHDSQILHTFVPNKLFSQLLYISPIYYIFKKN